MKLLFCLLTLVAIPAWAGNGAISNTEAASWLQRMSNASRKLPYEGIFVVRMGDHMQTVQVENRPYGASNSESRLLVLDGQPREVRCTRHESVVMAWGAKGRKLRRRLGTRHFPDLLPGNVSGLVKYYSVHLGKTIRVAGQECQIVRLVPKDRYRWGYQLCAEQYTGLPIQAVMLDGEGRPLLQYAFVKVREGTSGRPMPVMPFKLPRANLHLVKNSPLLVRSLPPGYAKLIAVKRRLPGRGTEVEHWVFSDGLNHISMFVEPAPKHLVSLKGESSHGLVNLLIRKVGNYQVTILGDAPWPAVKYVADNLSLR